MNTEKHAHATEVSISLRSDSRNLYISVTDDGIGFRHTRGTPSRPIRAANANGNGFGLNAMRDRVRTLGGRLSIITAPGQGVRVEICVPRPAGAVARSLAAMRHNGVTSSYVH
jgi:signal transduction histidine kinase